MKLTPHKWADQQTAAPPKLQALLHALASFANAKGIAYPSQDKICRRLSWSKGTAKKWSDLGRALGLFSTRKRFNPKKGHVDAMIYTLDLDRVVSAEEVEEAVNANRKIAISPMGSQIAKMGDLPPPCRKRGEIATDGKQLQSLTSKEDVHRDEVSEGSSSIKEELATDEAQGRPARDWLLVASDETMPAVEFRARYPNARFPNGMAWPDANPRRSFVPISC